MFYVGQEYLFGKEAERNIEQGIFWLGQCGCLYDANVRLAQVYMGMYGMEAIADVDKALQYSRRVYEMDKKGEKEDQPTRILAGNYLMDALLLGECYERGVGTVKDEVKAEQLYMERAGIPPQRTQKAMRQSDINLTMRYYTHLTTEDQRSALEQLPP